MGSNIDKYEVTKIAHSEIRKAVTSVIEKNKDIVESQTVEMVLSMDIEPIFKELVNAQAKDVLEDCVKVAVRRALSDAMNSEEVQSFIKQKAINVLTGVRIDLSSVATVKVKRATHGV